MRVLAVAVALFAAVALVWTLRAHDRPHTTRAAVPAPTERQLLAKMAKSVCGTIAGATTHGIRGLANELPQYPDVAKASAGERSHAAHLLRLLRLAAARWPTPAAAAAAGFDTRTAERRAGDTSVHYLHAEHRSYGTDPRLLDPGRPKALIYANAPGHRLALVGAMFSMPRGVHGPAPGGSITRWHMHHVCARGAQRGLKPRPDGSCPPGTEAREGSEMMHIWFTHDLRSAFAIHAPEPELCRAKLLPAGYCKHLHGSHGM